VKVWTMLSIAKILGSVFAIQLCLYLVFCPLPFVNLK
jgi:hypothetical protein